LVARSLKVELEHVDLDRGGRRVLRDINWRIRPGQRWALLGPNGAGKTQLLKLIAGDVWPTPTRRGRRSYVVDKERQDEPLGAKELIAYVGAERQDKYERYGWDLPVLDLVGTGIHRTDIVLDPLSTRQRREARRLLKRFGLQSFARRKVLTLSYGERRLALIARALAAKPRLLLLDEVFNGLDHDRRRLLMRYLELSQRSTMPWALAAHRREDLPRSVTHVLMLDRGRIAYAGSRARAPLAALISEPALEAPPSRRSAAPASRRQPIPLISIRNADVFVEHQPVLAGISWQIARGEHWAVLGRNGAGKSTLLKLLYGDLSPALGGTIERRGHPPGTSLEPFRKKVGLLSPELQSAHARDDVTVEEVVISGRHASIGLNERPTTAERRAARRWLRFFALEKLAERRPREISYGQMRRVLLARAMINAPRLLLLDEPCTGLDAASRKQVRAHLQRLADSGVQLVMGTHHRSDLVPAINRVLWLEKGRIKGMTTAPRSR
jgi:molybdate transport system ATP-binding protein